jgi:hypothetical protein
VPFGNECPASRIGNALVYEKSEDRLSLSHAAA